MKDHIIHKTKMLTLFPGVGGKDKIIFVTKEDHNTKSTAVFKDEDDEEPG